MKKWLSACLLLMFSSWQGYSQQFSTGGKEFRPVAAYPSTSFPVNMILICASELTEVIITIPPGGLVYPNVDTVILQPNTCDTFNCFGANNVGCLNKDTVTLIQSDKPITIYHFNGGDTISNSPYHYNVSTSLVLPVDNAGTDYYISLYSVPIFPPNFNFPIETNFWVSALEDSMLIEIVPAADVRCNIAQMDSPYTVWMNKGQYLATQTRSGSDSTFNGTYVHSLAVNGHKGKFMVYSGINGGVNTSQMWTTSHPQLQHNILPVSLWSHRYHAVPLLTRDSTMYMLQSAFDSTVITVNGNVFGTFNTADHAELLLNAPSVIESNNPFSCVQASREAIADSNANSNAFMYQLLGDSQVLTHAVFSSQFDAIAKGAIDTEFVCLISPTAHTGNITLDGVNIGSAFTAFSTDASYSYAQVSVNNATHILDCDSGCIAYMYGWGYFNGYGHIIGGLNELITGVKEELTIDNGQLIITPNPVKDICTFTLSNTSTDSYRDHNPNSLTLYDIMGRVILQQVFNNKTQLNIASLSPGIYIVEVKDKSGRSLKGKIVKE